MKMIKEKQITIKRMKIKIDKVTIKRMKIKINKEINYKEQNLK
jgi:hypothetical protein